MVIFQVLFLKYMAYIKTNFPWNRNGPEYMHSKDNNDDSYRYTFTIYIYVCTSTSKYSWKYVPKSSPTPKIRTQDVSHLKLWSELSHRWHEQPFKGPSTRAGACWCCRSCWRSGGGGGTAAARATAVGCRRLYHEERIHRVYTSVRANSPRVKRPELPCL
jgi:hypothetical protein